jgi:hypothetical protein
VGANTRALALRRVLRLDQPAMMGRVYVWATHRAGVDWMGGGNDRWWRETQLKQKACVKVVLQRPEWIRSESFRSESPPVQWSATTPSPHVPDPATGGRIKSEYLSLLYCSVSICHNGVLTSN